MKCSTVRKWPQKLFFDLFGMVVTPDFWPLTQKSNQFMFSEMHKNCKFGEIPQAVYSGSARLLGG